MFVRIIRREYPKDQDSESPPTKVLVHDTLYECDSMAMHPYQPYEDGPESLLLVLEGASKYFPIEHSIVKDGSVEIYVMNHDGKTIDSYLWSIQPTREVLEKVQN